MLKNAALNLIDRFLMIGARFVSAILIARLLGPEGYGVFQLALTASTIAASLGDLGFGIANNYLASRYPHVRPQLLGNALIFASSFGAISAALTGAAILVFRSHALLELPETYLWWIPLSIPVQAVQFSLIGLIYGANKFREKVIGTSLHSVLFVVAIVLFTSFGHLSTDSLMPLWITGLSVSSLYWIWILLRDVQGMPRWNRVILKEQLFYGRSSYLYNAAHLLNFRLDLFLVAFFLKAEHVGWYALATSITEVLLYLPKTLSNVILTETATKFKDGVKSSHHLVYKGIVLTMGAAGVGLASLGPWLIPLVFSSNFVPSIVPLLLLLPGTLAMALGIIAAYHLFGLGKAFQPSLAALMATVITVVLDLLLIPWLGIPGAALASTFAYTAFLIICLYFVVVESDIGVRSLLIPTKQDLETLLTIVKKVWPHGCHPPV